MCVTPASLFRRNPVRLQKDDGYGRDCQGCICIFCCGGQHGYCWANHCGELPDNVPSHPYAVAMEMVYLAPNAQVSLFPWKDKKENVKLGVRHIRTFLRANRS